MFTPTRWLHRLAPSLALVPWALRLVWQAARGWTLAWLCLVGVQGLLPVAQVYLTRDLVNLLVAVGQGGLGGLMDISRVVDRLGDQLDWGVLQRTAEAWGWQRGVYLTLALADGIFGLPLPAPIAQAIQAVVPNPDFVGQTQALLLQPNLDNSRRINRSQKKEPETL